MELSFSNFDGEATKMYWYIGIWRNEVPFYLSVSGDATGEVDGIVVEDAGVAGELGAEEVEEGTGFAVEAAGFPAGAESLSPELVNFFSDCFGVLALSAQLGVNALGSLSSFFAESSDRELAASCGEFGAVSF